MAIVTVTVTVTVDTDEFKQTHINIIHTSENFIRHPFPMNNIVFVQKLTEGSRQLGAPWLYAKFINACSFCASRNMTSKRRSTQVMTRYHVQQLLRDNLRRDCLHFLHWRDTRFLLVPRHCNGNMPPCSYCSLPARVRLRHNLLVILVPNPDSLPAER
jgi:hypothetical protein